MSAIAPAAHAPHPAPLGPGGHAAPALAHPRAAFGAVLDSLPKADARPKRAVGRGAGATGAKRRRGPRMAQSLSASLASLLPSAAEPVFAIRSTDGPRVRASRPSPAGVKPSTPSEDPSLKGAVAPGGAPGVGKLVGERAFHALDPTPWEATASLAQAASEPRRSASSPAQEAWPTQQATGAALSPPPAAAPSASAEPATHLIATMPSPAPPTPASAAPKGFRAERQSPSASAVANAASHKPPPAPEPRSGAATDDRQPSGAEKLARTIPPARMPASLKLRAQALAGCSRRRSSPWERCRPALPLRFRPPQRRLRPRRAPRLRRRRRRR